MNLLYNILLILSIGITIGIIVAIVILTYHMGKRSIREDVKKCLVFTRKGNHWQPPIKGKLTQQTAKAYTYDYSKNKTVIVPKKYDLEWYNGYRLLFLSNAGNLLADNSVDKKNISINDNEMSEKETIIYEVLHANIGGSAVRAIKSTQAISINIVLILVALFIGIIGTFGVTQFQKQISSKNVNTISNPAPTQEQETQQKLIPVK